MDDCQVVWLLIEDESNEVLSVSGQKSSIAASYSTAQRRKRKVNGSAKIEKYVSEILENFPALSIHNIDKGHKGIILGMR